MFLGNAAFVAAEDRELHKVNLLARELIKSQPITLSSLMVVLSPLEEIQFTLPKKLITRLYVSWTAIVTT